VQQCWIYGDSLRDYTVGVIVVDPDTLKKHGFLDDGVTMDDRLMEKPELK